MWHGLVERLIERAKISKMMKGARIIPASQNIAITRSNWTVLCQQILSQDMFEQDGLTPMMMIYASGRVTLSGSTIEIQLYDYTNGQFLLTSPIQITSTTNEVVSSDAVSLPVNPSLIQIVARKIGGGWGFIDCVQLNIFNKFTEVIV